MSTPILATKLYIPAPPPTAVARPRLVERLNAGLHRKLTLISAPAGFGKTTLVSAWAATSGRQVAWLSLDAADNDLTRFLTCFVAALRIIAANTGEGVLRLLQSPQPPPMEATLTEMLNDIASSKDDVVLVLDDYQVIDSKPVEAAVAFLLEHLPPQVRVVMTTREDPQLPLARLRGGGQLSELRVNDLRFTASEAARFLNQAMGLDLSADDVATLETRTEGWIAGLQLAALSLQSRPDAPSFIQSFTGSHHFVLDYLLEEVLQRQSESIQTFLLRTSILDRLSGALCDAALGKPSGSSQATLEQIERANLFLVALDDERRWFRYHHLFGDLLRQRLQQSNASSVEVAELHNRASQWYEDHGNDLEAFQHAAAANNIDRAERLIEGRGVPLQYRGAGGSVLRWLESLPASVLDARPSLWVTYATALFFEGRHTAVEQKLQAAEASLQGAGLHAKSRDLIGRIASIRATLAIIQHDAETIIAQSRLALEYLAPDNIPIRTATTYTLGYAHQLHGDRLAARQAYADVVSASGSVGDSIYTIAATLGLAQIQESDNQLFVAARTYDRVLELIGDPPRGMASEAYLGLARIHYEWNELDVAEQHAQQCLKITGKEDSVDTTVSCGVFFAQLKLARGDVSGAIASLAEADEFVDQHKFVSWKPKIASVRVSTMLHQGNVSAAADLAEAHDLPISQARVHLARGDSAAALAVLEPWRRHVEAKGWADKRLEVLLLQAQALQAHGDRDSAVHVLMDGVGLAEPGGLIRSFVDEGAWMATLLSAAAAEGRMTDVIRKLQAAFEAGKHAPAQSPIDQLSQRELEVLRLIARGLSNQEIGERLFLALDTVKGHNRRIFGKLQVQRRTEAVARAREIGLS